jgi:hypothetical protein
MKILAFIPLLFVIQLKAQMSPQFSSFGQAQVGVSNSYSSPGVSMGYAPHPAQIQNRVTPQQSNEEVLNEAREAYGTTRNDNSDYYISPGFVSLTQAYSNALKDMKAMLGGKEQLSVGKAYYELESAYGNPYMSYKQFNDAIDKSAGFIKKWMAENKLNTASNEALNYAIQRFMADTLTTINKIPDSKDPPVKVTHMPFKYDYNDFKGENDYRNFFVTKCIATGYGQCNSMPAVYLCLAEALGAKAYLSFAPKHSFIKYPDAGGYIHNYEPTGNWHITDRWYQDNLYIDAKAMKNGIYLKPMNKREVIANCIVDLAISYMNRFGVADGKFVDDCIVSAKAEFKNRQNIYIDLTYSSLLAGMLNTTLHADRAADISDTARNPKARFLYDELKKNEGHITALGYQEIPNQAYSQMMQVDSVKANLQQAERINGKQKRELFITTKK